VDDREKKRRFFVGVELDDVSRAACAAVSEGLQRTGLPARYESSDKFHLTLAFLGDTGADQYEGIAAALDGVAAQNASFELTLDKIGAFPHERKPRIVYIGAREQGAPFRNLARSVRGAYAALGFKFDDDSVAHVTLARAKDPRAPLRSIEFAPIAFEVVSLSLFESIFDPKANTSRYEVAISVTLSPTASAA
jgi:2'-5' RNA ligase